MPLNGAFNVVGSWDNQGSVSIAVTFDQEKTFDNINKEHKARVAARMSLSN